MANNTNWLNISSMSGSSGQTILTLSAQRNLVRDYKTATIRAYNPVYNISAETYVTIESYTPYINVTPALVGVPESGGTYQLSVEANCGYVIAYPDLVSSYSTSAATGNTTITFSVPSTYEETTLIGNIVFTDESGQVSKTVRIEQYGAGAEIVYWPGIITFPSSGGEQYFSVSANCPYTITNVGGADWFSVSPSSGYTGRTDFTVTAGENTGDTNISGYISINGPGSSGGVIEVIQQKAETRLIVGYWVTSTTDPTTLYMDGSSWSKVEYPDGTEITPSQSGAYNKYTFPSTGMQYVYYTLTGTSINDSGFNYCQDVKEVFIPNGVTSIGVRAFRSTSLTNIVLPDSVATIGNNAFYGCSSLSSITLSNGLTSVGSYCFYNCSSLSSVTFPSGVTNIGEVCFSRSSVSSITFTSLVPPTLGSTDALSSSSLSEIIVPCIAVEDYLTAWPQYSQYISCQDDGHTLYFITDTSNVAGIGETRTITILNTNVNPNRIGLTLPSDFPQQGSYIVDGNVIYITYPRNPSYTTNRTWTIGVVAQTNDGVNLSGSYRITQLANLTYSIPYTADTSTVDATGETRTITIDTSNLVASSITIGIEGATGVTYTYENGVITIVFPENTGFEQYVTVTVDGITTGGSSANATINYVQDGEYIIPTGDSRLIVIYNVTSTTSSTPILYLTGNTNSFSKAEVNGSSAITMSSSYRFNRIGRQAIFYTLKNNVLGRTGAIIDRGDFYDVDSIVAVYIPSSVTEVNVGCFLGCSNLTSVTIPNSVTSLEDFAFCKCNSLTDVTLPNNLLSIGADCFLSCSSLTTIIVPDTVTSIGSACFGDCTSLSNAVIGSGITKLGESDYQTEESTEYNGVNGYTFCGCTSLATVTFGGQVTEIGNHCFQECTSLRNINFLPSTVERIGTAAFLGCVSLSSVTLPLSTTFIGDACFSGCSAITNVTINDNLKYVGHSPDLASEVGQLPDGGVFIGCTSISSVTFPESLRGVGANSFQGCSGVTFMKFFGSTPPKIKQGSEISSGANSFGSVEYTFPFYVPCSVLNDYQTAFGSFYSQRIQCFNITATSITLDVASAITGSGQTTVTVLPAGSTTSISYTTSNSSIATVDSGGQITVLADGQVTICAVDSISNLSDCKSVTVQKDEISLDTPLTFEILSGNSLRWKDSRSATSIEYSLNNGGWNELEPNATLYGLKAGDKVSFRGNNSSYATCSFNGSFARFNVYGNIMSLCDKYSYSSMTVISANSAFDSLFSETYVVSAEKLFLPATSLTQNCYYGMFYRCTSLAKAPELPAPVTKSGCYMSMFYGCSSLSSITCLATDISAGGTYDWVNGVAASGTFVKAPSMTSWTTGTSGIPTGWTVQDAT